MYLAAATLRTSRDAEGRDAADCGTNSGIDVLLYIS